MESQCQLYNISFSKTHYQFNKKEYTLKMRIGQTNIQNFKFTILILFLFVNCNMAKIVKITINETLFNRIKESDQIAFAELFDKL